MNNRVRKLVLVGTLATLLFGVPAAGQGVPPLPTADPSATPASVPDTPRDPNALALKIAPTEYEGTIEPGKSKDGAMDVFNVSRRTVTVQPEVQNVRMVGDNGDLEYYIGTNQYRLHSFVEIDKTPFVLQPGEARRLKFRINFPAGLFPGGYFGAILMDIVPPAAGGEGNVISQTGRVGTLLILTAKGEVQQVGRIESVSVNGRGLAGSKTLDIKYANTGNTEQRPLGVAYHPTGTVAIKDLLGLTVRRQKVEGGLVFPGAARRFQATVSKPLWFGRYTAEVSVVPGSGQADTKRVSFWAFSPLGLAIAGLVLLALVWGMITLLRRRRGPGYLDQTPPAP